MASFEINYVAIFVAGILALILGFLWMSVVWKVPYRKYMYNVPAGATHVPLPKAVMIKTFVIYILISFVTALVYSIALQVWKAGAATFGYDGHSFGDAVWFTLFLWAGFTWPFAFGKRLWQFKSWHVVLIDTSYELVRFLLFLVLFWSM
jgi:hypothetical protein